MVQGQTTPCPGSCWCLLAPPALRCLWHCCRPPPSPFPGGRREKKSTLQLWKSHPYMHNRREWYSGALDRRRVALRCLGTLWGQQKNIQPPNLQTAGHDNRNVVIAGLVLGCLVHKVHLSRFCLDRKSRFQPHTRSAAETVIFSSTPALRTPRPMSAPRVRKTPSTVYVLFYLDLGFSPGFHKSL